MILKDISVNSLMLYFEQTINETTLNKVQESYLALKELKGIIDLTPSYCSILVEYDFLRYDALSIKKAIEEQCKKYRNTLHKKSTKHIKIPTNYEKNLDLERVATHNQLSIEEVIQLHTKTTYRVYAIGFMVGFAYLAPLNSKLITPRLSSPRNRVPKGSVAIADTQTAIYPQDSAGGWNIIGHTEFTEFERFEIGDSVEFVNEF